METSIKRQAFSMRQHTMSNVSFSVNIIQWSRLGLTATSVRTSQSKFHRPTPTLSIDGVGLWYGGRFELESAVSLRDVYWIFSPCTLQDLYMLLSSAFTLQNWLRGSVQTILFKRKSKASNSILVHYVRCYRTASNTYNIWRYYSLYTAPSSRLTER